MSGGVAGPPPILLLSSARLGGSSSIRVACCRAGIWADSAARALEKVGKRGALFLAAGGACP